MVAAFVEYLIRNHALEETEREDAVYGLTLLTEKLITYFILFCLAAVLGKPVGAILFMVSFVLLRQTTGGFHAESFAGCLACSALTLVVALRLVVPLFQRSAAAAGVAAVAAVLCVLRFAPVNHPNVCLSEAEERQYRRWSRYVLGLELGVSVVGYLLQMQWQAYIVAAVVLCAVLIGIAKIIKQEVKRDDREKGKPCSESGR